jgi:hypothetical protein
MSAGGGGSFNPEFVKTILSNSTVSNAPQNSSEITTLGEVSDQKVAAQIKKAQESSAAAKSSSAAAPSDSQQQQAAAAPVSVSVAPEGSKLAPAAATNDDPMSVRLKQPQGRNTDARNALISKTGREFGPDIALKVRPNIVGKEIVGKEAAGEKTEGIINSKSSITEVLNILAFLLNNDEQIKRSVITEFSYDHDGIFDKLYASFKDNAPPLFDIETLKTLKPSESSASVASAETKSTVSITIPGTILKRDERCELKNDIILNSEQIQPLISACILQMVNILENTRQVFGGWAKLFKGMQGGSNSKSKTKTRRNNRRRH